MNRTLAIFLGGLTLAGGLAAPALAGDPEAGRKVANMCRTCHGADGYAAIPIAPHIGGEPAEYLEAQLLAFKIAEQASQSARRGNYDEAMSKLDEAQRIAPGFALVYQYRSNVAYLMGDRDGRRMLAARVRRHSRVRRKVMGTAEMANEAKPPRPT